MKKVTELYAKQEKVLEVSLYVDPNPRGISYSEYIYINGEIFLPYDSVEKILKWSEGSFTKKVRYDKFHSFLQLNDIKIFKLKDMDRGNIQGTRVFKGIKKIHLPLLIEYELTCATQNDDFEQELINAYWEKIK